MALFEEIVAEVKSQLKVGDKEMTLSTSFTEDLGADSLDVVEMIMALEEKFGIEIPDSEAESMKTIGDVVAFVEANQVKKA
jgi:acyl carrier protein